MRTFLISPIFPFFAFITILQAEDKLPPAPTGYSWQGVASIKSFVLKPDGWFFKETKKGETDGFFITKENVDQLGVFKSGLSLNCIRSVSKKTGLSPSAYATNYVEAAAIKHTLVEKSFSTQGAFKAVRFRYIDIPTGKDGVTILSLLIANDKTGTLFLIIFEAPTAEWEAAEKTGQVILKRLMLDDEI